MKAKSLLAWTVVAVVLVILAVVSSRRTQPRGQNEPLGRKVLPALDVNQVEQVRITSGSGTIAVARVNGAWCVPAKYNYPAAFPQIRTLLRKLADLKVGQTLPADRRQMETLHLLSPFDTTGTNRDAFATRVELKAANGAVLATLDAGKTRSRQATDGNPYGAFPDGRYIATGDGRVCVVTETLDELTAAPAEWVDNEFLNVAAADLVEVMVTGATNGPVKLMKPGDGPFALEGVPAGREPDSSKIDRLTGALGWLRFEDIADPTLPPAVTGLDKPVVYCAKAKDGRVYTLDIGAAPTNDSRRYVTVHVAFAAPPAAATNAAAAASSSAAADAKALNEKLGKWIYLLSAYSVESMTLPVTELTKEKPKEEPPAAAATNTAVQAAAPQPPAPAAPAQPPAAP